MKLAIEGGCNAVASTFGVLGIVARKYAHKIPFMVKINHNELLTYPNKADQIMFGTIKQAADMGAAAVGATIYFGSPESGRQIVEVSQAFALAHEFGMATVLWCYLRNNAFKVKDAEGKSTDYHVASDLTGQANHLGVTIQADIIKQKLPENNGGFKALNMGGSSYGKLDERMYTELNSDHPIDLTRYQIANNYMGRIGLINSGGASGKNDLGEAAADRRDQQARGRHGPHLRPQGVPEADEGRRGAAQHDSRCVSGSRRDDCVSDPSLWRISLVRQQRERPADTVNGRGASSSRTAGSHGTILLSRNMRGCPSARRSRRFCLKTMAFLLTGSVGLLSDAAESLVNLVGAIVALIMLTIAARPADESHAHGHSKAEYFSSGIEGVLILIAAVMIAYAAIQRLFDPQPLEDVGIGIVVAVAASAINFFVARVLLRAGKQYDSITLEADGKHLMTDVWTSVGVIARCGGGRHHRLAAARSDHRVAGCGQHRVDGDRPAAPIGGRADGCLAAGR